MINKYQAGGAAQGSILQEIAKLPQDLQKKIMTAFGKWAQAKGLNIQQLQGNEQVLEKAMGQFLQEMQGAQKARLGAKLNYLRSIKGDCPEGQEIKYFREGGLVCKKCVEKGAAGAKAKPKGKDAVKEFKKKKACGGMKAKFEEGKKIKKPVNPSDTVHVAGKPYSLTNMNGTRVDNRFPAYLGAVEKKDRAKAKAGDKDAQRRQLKADEVTAPKNGAKMPKDCKGGKTKKHLFGGIIGF